jgi:RHS repeat-associated protein
MFTLRLKGFYMSFRPFITRVAAAVLTATAALPGVVSRLPHAPHPRTLDPAVSTGPIWTGTPDARRPHHGLDGCETFISMSATEPTTSADSVAITVQYGETQTSPIACLSAGPPDSFVLTVNGNYVPNVSYRAKGSATIASAMVPLARGALNYIVATTNGHDGSANPRTDMASVTVEQTGSPLPVIPNSSVSPDNAAATATANRSGLTASFVVHDLQTPQAGAAQDTVRLTCGHAGFVISCAVAPSVLITRGDSVLVPVTYATGGVANSANRLTLSTQTDSGSYNIAVVPVDTLSLRATPARRIARFTCPTVGAGPGGAVQCGDLLYAHAFPAYRTRNKARAFTLLYNSSTAAPTPLVVADYTTEVGDPADAYAVTVSRGATTISTMTFDAHTISASEPRVRRLVVPVDTRAAGLATGAYDVTVSVRRIVAGQPQAAQVRSTTLIVVDRTHSEFGSGWWPAGVDRLYPNQDGGRVLLVAGDASATLFTPNGDGSFRAPPGEYSALREVAGGYERTLAGKRLRVTYDVAGLPRTLREEDEAPVIASYSWTAGGANGAYLDRITDPVGRFIEFTRDSAGRDTGVTIPGTKHISLIPQSRVDGATLAAIVDPDGLQTSFGYSSGNALMTSSQARATAATIYTYDAIMRVSSVSPAALPARLFTAWQRAGAPDPAHPGTPVQPAVPALTDTVGTTVTWQRVVSGSSHEVRARFRVDSTGAVAVLVLPAQSPMAITRDSAGNPVDIRTASGKHVLQQWDVLGGLTSTSVILRDSSWLDRTGVRTEVTRYDYDPVWHAVSKVTLPDQATFAARAEYDTYGRQKTLIDADSNVTRLTYTADGFVETILEPNAITGKDTPDSLPMVYQYDSASRNIVSAGQGNRMTTYGYAPNGMDLISVTDAEGKMVMAGLDSLKRVLGTRTWSPNKPADTASSVVFGFDDVTHRRTQTDPLGHTTTWYADDAGRPVHECRPGAGENGSSYFTQCINTVFGDGLNPTQVQTPGAQPTSLEYDDAGRLIRKVVGGDVSTYAYDEDGNLVNADNANARIRRRYDVAGRLRCEQETVRALNTPTTFRGITAFHDYDANGRRSVTYYSDYASCDLRRATGASANSGAGTYDPERPATWAAIHDGAPAYVDTALGATEAGHRIANAYTRAGLLKRISNHMWSYYPTDSAIWTYTYDKHGRATALSTPQASVAPTWRYNGIGDLIEYHASPYPSGNDYWSATGFSYDKDGRITGVTKPGGTVAYVYDGLGRLFQDVRPLGNSDRYLYDVGGNRRHEYSKDGRIDYDYFDPSVISHSTEPLDIGRLRTRVRVYNNGTRDSTYLFYDKRGNNVAAWGRVDTTAAASLIGDRKAVFDDENRMVSELDYAEGPRNMCGLGTYWKQDRQFWYDALGRRVIAKSKHSCSDDWGTTRFFWLDDNVAVKSFNYTFLNPSADTPDYAWPSLMSNGQWIFYGAGGTDDVIGSRNGTNGSSPQGPERYSEGTHWIHVRDERGSVIRTVCWTPPAGANAENCTNAANATAYTGFGQNAGGGSIPETRAGYNGAEASGGLVYMRNRWYDPNTGRFTQEDPTGFGGGSNLYAYVGNDPVTYRDPFGLDRCKDLQKKIDERTRDVSDRITNFLTYWTSGESNSGHWDQIRQKRANLSDMLDEYESAGCKDKNDDDWKGGGPAERALNFPIPGYQQVKSSGQRGRGNRGDRRGRPNNGTSDGILNSLVMLQAAALNWIANGGVLQNLGAPNPAYSAPPPPGWVVFETP